MSKLLFLAALALFSAALAAAPLSAQVTIRADFPGGNIVVEKNDGATVHLAPDLRGGQPWFYWYFEAEAVQPGAVSFVFKNPPQIGVRGPAVSEDSGQTWRWLGTADVQFATPGTSNPPPPREEKFAFNFRTAKQRVRFAVGIPYLPDDLKKFLAKHAGNPALKTAVLTKSRQGTDVESLQVGAARADTLAVLVTARHHACEALASYVLEGWLDEALSDSPAGREFRRRFVLYCVPLVDRDGVQAGDQGKNRFPHDHNRDYGPDSIYPEIRAIQQLAETHDVRLALDLHCPALRGDVHEAFHFLGLGVPHVKENLNELIAWLGEERPQILMAPLNFLTDPNKPNAVNRRINSHHFALRSGSLFAATLEIPYAQPNTPLDAALAREYGRGLLAAFVRTQFLPSDNPPPRGAASHASLAELRNEISRSYRGQPQATDERLATIAAAENSPLVQRIEAKNWQAALRLHQKKWGDAIALCDSVLNDPHATARQRATAALQQMQAIASNPDTSVAAFAAAFDKSQTLPHPSREHQAKVFEIVGDFYLRHENAAQALLVARQQLAVANWYEQGKILNRIASLHQRLGQKEEAVAATREAIAVLRPLLTPQPPRSIFGALMTADLFDAINSLPESTAAEKQSAATLVFDHPIAPADLKKRVQRALSGD